MSLLLNLERPQSAADYWEPGSPLQAQLTADEVRGSSVERYFLGFACLFVFLHTVFSSV